MDRFPPSLPQWGPGVNPSDPLDHPSARSSGGSAPPNAAPTGQPPPPPPPPPHPQPILQVCAEVKPRLTKEQHDILERHFQQQPKPSTHTKKGFADMLGVPLDKINNWFQNRRAKVKQDYKKQQNAMAMLQAAMPHAIHNPSAFVPVSQPLPSSAPATLIPVPDELPSQPFPPEAPVPFSHPQEFTTMVPTIMETTQPASREGIVHHLQAAGYAVPQMSGPDDADAFFANAVFPDPTFYGFPAPFPDLTPEMGEPFNPYLAGANIPVQSIEGGQLSLPTIPSSASINSAPSVASSYSHSNFTDESTHPTAASSSSPCDPLDGSSFDPSTIQPPPENTDTWDTQNTVYQHGNPSAPILSSPGGSKENGQDDANPSPLDLSEDSFARRNSSTSALADSMSTVGINVQNKESDFKTPSQQLSLAARRQRPRPTQLSSNSLRSVSYSAGMPVSPGANQTLSASDQALRRIRSSAVTNGGGRIQKPGSSSGQRSPMALAFDAATSPKWVRYPSGSSYVSSPPVSITASNLAPPTPNTPNDIAHWPPWQSPISKTCAQPGDVIPAVSYPEAVANAAMMTFSSPPATPLDPEQQAQYHAYLKHQQQAIYRDTPPQSAPATQQAFVPTTFATAQPMPPSLSINDDKIGHFRRPSLPDGPHAFPTAADMQWPAVPMFNAVGDLQISAPVPRPVQFTNPFPSAAGNASVIKADFSVHQYTPPDANGGVPAPLPRQESAPKVYHFSNHGPRDFKS